MNHLDSAEFPRRYRYLTWILSPLIMLHLLWRASHDGGWLYLCQRLGWRVPRLGRALWVHAASVGEINTSLPLLRGLRQKYPTLQLLVTTNTPTGKAALARCAVPGVEHCYLPIDFTSCVRRFLSQNPLCAAVFIETELWPNLLHLKSMPLSIVNARLSPRTLDHTDGIVGQTYRSAVQCIDSVLARSIDDARAFQRLGVPENRIQVIGNLKFACSTARNTPMFREPPFQRRYCLLASTHNDEERQLAGEWLKHQRSDLLVIAPRHPERCSAIVRQLQSLNAEIAIRSKGEWPLQDTRIYLADTFGEMSLWFQHAAAVFMGGSLTPRGGHNMLEPAGYCKPVVVGPHTHNFSDEMTQLTEADAVIQVSSAQSAVDALIDLIDDPDRANELGQKANAVLTRHSGVELKYLEALAPLLAVCTHSAEPANPSQ